MDEQNIGEPGLVNSGSEAKVIANLTDAITVRGAYSNQPVPLFGNQWIHEPHIWSYLFYNHGPQTKGKITEIGDFIKSDTTIQSIRSVNDAMMEQVGGKGSIVGFVYRSTILYPLLERLSKHPRQVWEDQVKEWQEEWSGPITPERFRTVMKMVFTVLSGYSAKGQKEFLARRKDIPVSPSEADMLADIFSEVDKKSRDPKMIEESDGKNRELVGEVSEGKFHPPGDALYHTTDLGNLSSIVDRGILSPECTSLTTDGHKEADFGVSFHTFLTPPETIADLGDSFGSKGRDTVRKIERKIHLAFLDPLSFTENDYLLYPPDSFWLYKDTKDSTAARYIGGFDGSPEDFDNRSIAYALIGLPSTALNFVILDEALKEDYAEVARKFPFYIPAYSYSGGLIFTPQEYDVLRTQN